MTLDLPFVRKTSEVDGLLTDNRTYSDTIIWCKNYGILHSNASDVKLSMSGIGMNSPRKSAWMTGENPLSGETFIYKVRKRFQLGQTPVA
jgi:hypothetical protein